MTRLAVVDESKSGVYVMAACSIALKDVDRARRQVRDLVLPGQRALHMTKESASRRRSILTMVTTCPMLTTVYVAKHRDDGAARRACLRAIVRDEAARGTTRLVIDRDDTLVRSDGRTLVEATRGVQLVGGSMRYEHEHRNSELLLALPDAVAWAWASKKGEWARRIAHIVNARDVS